MRIDSDSGTGGDATKGADPFVASAPPPLTAPTPSANLQLPLQVKDVLLC